MHADHMLPYMARAIQESVENPHQPPKDRDEERSDSVLIKESLAIPAVRTGRHLVPSTPVQVAASEAPTPAEETGEQCNEQ